MNEKEQKRAELLFRREQFIRLVDSFTEDNINLALMLMKSNQDLKLTFKRTFHPLLELIEGNLGAGYSILLHKIRQQLERGGHYYNSKNYVADFWLRFYKYYAKEGRINNVWHWINKWYRNDSFKEIKEEFLLQDFFMRDELKDLHIKKIDLKQAVAPNLAIAVAERHLTVVEELIIENSEEWATYLISHLMAMPKLQKLTLKNCNLSELPQTLATLPHLKEIDIDNNNFTALPDVLQDCKVLQEISIRSNQLTILPDWLWKCKKLKRLMISHNPMPILSEYVFTMPNLWWLEIEGNGISNLNIPQKKSNITWLNISHNPIIELPTNLSYLQNLFTLDARYCQISVLPSWLGDMNQLKLLYLTGNLFTTLPLSLEKLGKLETLYIGDMKITDMPYLIKTSLRFLAINTKLLPIDLANKIKSYLPTGCYISG